MDPPNLESLKQKAAALPAAPGVYLYKDAAGVVIYVGKAKALRDRVRNYFLEERLAEVKTGTLISEAADLTAGRSGAAWFWPSPAAPS